MGVLDEVMLGKPSDKEDARRMLSALSGRAHQVMTGIAFVDNTTLAEEKTGFLGWVEVTTVVFRKISQQEIKAYIATGEPMDKAAAYGIQGKAAKFVDLY
jgi:septum formation protein